jgi:hypothetical protein
MVIKLSSGKRNHIIIAERNIRKNNREGAAMRKKKAEVWIDDHGNVRVREEIDKNHWKVATLKPELVRETQEWKP